MAAEDRIAHPWRAEMTDLARAFSGAFLFGIPLLFTMEMWWIGQYAEPWKLVLLLGLTLIANLGLNYFAGFKPGQGWGNAIEETIDAVAAGVVASGVVLVTLDRIAIGDPLDSVLGKIILQSVPLSIGASLANIVFQKGDSRQGDDGPDPDYHPWKALFNDIGATAIGGIFIGVSIAPTDEVPMLAAGMDGPHEAALVLLSLLIAYGIVFVSGFDRTSMPVENPGPFQRPLTETTASYLVSLLVAALILYMFDRIDAQDPVNSIVSQVIVLGLPTTVGGAAGRLAV